MARRASVRYWESRKAYCCWMKGKQHVLQEGPDDYPHGPTYQAAVKRFAAMVTLSKATEAGEENPLRAVCDLYLRHCSSSKMPSTFATTKKHLTRFVDALDPQGTVEVGSLTPFIVNIWLDEMRQPRKHGKRVVQWSAGTVRIAIKTIKAALNWAVQDGLIPKNPLKHLSAPGPRSRGREALLGKTPAERQKNHLLIMKAAPASFRNFIAVLEATGARPGELCKATANDFDTRLGAIVYYGDANRIRGESGHKNARHGKDRIIILSGEALAIVRDLAERYPFGPLFRSVNNAGKKTCRPWSDKSIEKTFWRIREKVKLPNLTAYSYRHTFATAWLEQGKSVDVLASLLGNSPEVIRRHYAHLLEDKDNLRRQLEAFRSVSVAEETHTQKTSSASDAEEGGLRIVG
jgi:integrase